jgi:hypothetical protein
VIQDALKYKINKLKWDRNEASAKMAICSSGSGKSQVADYPLPSFLAASLDVADYPTQGQQIQHWPKVPE